MTKKITITTVVSYVFLAISLGLFFAAGLGVTVSQSISVEYGLKLGSYSYSWHFMSLISGNLFTTNRIIAITGWAVIGAFFLATIGLLCAKKGFSRRIFEAEFVQMVVCTLVSLGTLFVLRYFNLVSKFKSYNGSIQGIWYILWIVFFLLYGLTQIINYIFVITRKAELQEEIIEEVIEDEPKTEEVKEEEKPEEEPAQAEEEKVEETPVEEEKVEEEPVQEEAPAEEEPTPVEEETEEVEEDEAEEASEDEVELPEFEIDASAPKAKRVKVTFEERLAKADPTLIEKYHEIREEIMSYGIKSRVSSSGDTFRLHTVKYMKIVVAGKKLKLYMKLNPRDYDSTTIPHSDASSKALYAEIPMVFKVNSPLSVKRAKGLIADMMAKENIQKKAPKKAKED